jgi:hypothetical protein
MNARKYPRTLAEAFPRSADYANPISCYRLSVWERIGMWFARLFT